MILATLSASLYLGLNCTAHKDDDTPGWDYRYYGWPFFIKGTATDDDGSSVIVHDFDTCYGVNGELPGFHYAIEWNYKNMLLNVLVGVVAMLGIIVVSEWWIRSRGVGRPI